MNHSLFYRRRWLCRDRRDPNYTPPMARSPGRPARCSATIAISSRPTRPSGSTARSGGQRRESSKSCGQETEGRISDAAMQKMNNRAQGERKGRRTQDRRRFSLEVARHRIRRRRVDSDSLVGRLSKRPTSTFGSWCRRSSRPFWSRCPSACSPCAGGHRQGRAGSDRHHSDDSLARAAPVHDPRDDVADRHGDRGPAGDRRPLSVQPADH